MTVGANEQQEPSRGSADGPVALRSDGVEARHIPCNACGADQFRPASTVDGWTIGSCAVCGLVYVNPAPFFDPNETFSEMSREFEYTDYMHQPITESIQVYERNQLAANLSELTALLGSRRDEQGPLRFLDIGCGSGASVRAAKDLGWGAIGIDLDPLLIQKGREELEVDIRCTPLLEADLPSGGFDFIKLRDVVEHLPNPSEVLAKVADLLSEDGIVLIVTPNEGGLFTQLRLLLRRPRKLVATVPPPHHLHSFAPATLDRTLRRSGLVPRKMFTTTPNDADYVTSHNVMRATGNAYLRPAWRLGQAAGMGAVLVSWASPE